MAGRHHVLLIGIDAYDGGGTLNGCVNDIDAIQRLLIDGVGVSRDSFTRLAAPRSGTVHETDLPEELPTLERIRAALFRLGTDIVGPEDHVFIYYSGHGTQCVVTDPQGQRFSREALLPKDKIKGIKRQFLFDWELNTMLAQIAKRAHALTVVLDCCSAAGATRSGTHHATAQDRFLSSPGEYRLALDEPGPRNSVRGLAAAVGQVKFCQLIAACRDDQRARESVDQNGHAHGELTRALLRQLNALLPSELADLRWGRVWRAVEADVRRANRRQSPWLSGSFGRCVFGLGRDDDTDPGFGVQMIGSRYKLDVGALAGVTEGAEVAVYSPTPPAFPPLGSNEDLAARQGLLRVSQADQAMCEAIAITPFTLPNGARGRLARSGPAAKLRVAVVPSDKTLIDCVAMSPLVEVVSPGDAELTLARRPDGDWILADDVHGTGEIQDEPVLAAIHGDSLEAARAAVEHYHAYITPLRMARACRDLPSLLRLWLLDCNGCALDPNEAQAPDLPEVPAGTRAPYELAVGDQVCIAVENNSDLALWVTVVDCAASGRVLILGEKQVSPRSRHVFWEFAVLGRPFPVSLSDDRSLGVDRIAAIGTTRPDVSLQYLKRETSFAQVLRHRSTELGSTLPVERWTSTLTAIRISH